MRRTFIPIYLIDQASFEGWLLSLAFFVKLKAQNSHGWFRTVDCAVKRTGMSKGACHKHISVLIEKGLLEKTDGVYVMKKRKDFKMNHICNTVLTDGKETLSFIKYKLLFKSIERDARQQRYRIKLNDSCKSVLQRTASCLKDVVFTYDHYLKYGVSKTTGYRLAKFCEEQGYVHLRTVGQRIKKCTYEQFRKELNELLKLYHAVFYSKGYVHYTIGTKYELNEYYRSGMQEV